MKTVLVIGLGSFIGGAGRYLLSTAIQNSSKSLFPYGTLLVNLAGCLLIGLVFSLAVTGTITQEWRLYLATGVIGGFTTFSAFSLETLQLLQSGRMMYAMLYAGCSVGLGILCTFLGFGLGKVFAQ